MQRKFQHTFTKSVMNKDLDARLLGPNEYRDGQNIAVSRSESDDVGALENVLGNLLFNQLTSNTSTNQASLLQFIGWFINETTNNVYIFATDFQDSSSDQISSFAPPSSIHRIIVANLNSNTIQTIVNGRFLNFSYNSPILDATMIETQLFWTDNRNQPRNINVELATLDPNYYFHEDHISLAKYYPYKPIQLFEEYELNGGLVETTAATTWYGAGNAGSFNSIYPYFIFDKSAISTTTLATITNNIGMQGYVKASISNSVINTIYDFKIAYVQELTSLPSDPFAGQDGIAVFVDRDLTSVLNKQDIDGMKFNSTIHFVDKNSKDVLSPWLREDQVKLSVDSISTSAPYPITYVTGGTKNYNYAQALYKFGTRSPYNYLNDSGATTHSPFQIPNHFPKNTGTASDGYARVTHPKLNPNKYYVISSVTDPTLSSLSFGISELSSFVNGTLTEVKASSLLTAGDVLTVHWPNKFYNYNFPGNKKFLEDKFIRFAYRFKYQDGQYSIISPFTQEVFIPKQKGYFLKEVGKTKSGGTSLNNYVPQENIAGQNTVVDFMENEITEVKLKIPCEYAINTLAVNLKVAEIDILYKESMSSNIKVAETLEVTSASITSNSTKFLDYVYQSQEAIKTLRSAETTRVYDTVPVRSKTLTSSGNRVILGNFFDRHSSPNNLAYYVGSGRKLTQGSTSQNQENNISSSIPNKFSNIAYPNHSLKQNRTYQVGLILQDRYGRSSDVILSKFTETNFTLQSGTFANDPQVFGGSTIFHNYLDSVTSPLTLGTDILDKNVVNSGIVNWPGDSLKILFTEQIPRSISYASGYPGLYEDPLATTTITNSSVANKYIEIPTGGARDSIQPGDTITWTTTGITYSAVIQWGIAPYPSSVLNRYGIVTENGNDPVVYPASSQSVDFISSGNTTGWFSYKVVVKQLEQDYYNVYLPSLLNGAPVIKPLTLNVDFVIGSKIATMGNVPFGAATSTIEFLTFPLIEGMKIVTAAGNIYYINNVLNYIQFEMTGAAVATEAPTSAFPGNATFSTESSSGVLNTSTLLTDNANKIPPALLETSPVQQQYSPSDTTLVPRVAQLNQGFVNDQPYFNNNLISPGPVFPNLNKLTVQSIGNFENLFKRGSYNGLYNADTDPPTAIIQNTFNIGADSEIAKPSSEVEFLPAIYETNPTLSNIEIFYETSTSGSVKELNTLIRDNLTVPTQLVLYPGSGTGVSPLSITSFSESLQYSAAATIVKFQIVDQNGVIVTYASAEELNLGTAQYESGSAVQGTPFTVTQSAVSSEQNDNVYLLKTTSTNPMYSSGNGTIDNVSFNINFNYLQFAILPTPYSIQLNTFVQNSAPVFNVSKVDNVGTVYYVGNNSGIDANGDVQAPGPTNWGNADGSNTSFTKATNGSHVSNLEVGNGVVYQLFVKNANMFGTSSFVQAADVKSLSLSVVESNGGCSLNIGQVGGEYTTGNIQIEIRATDQNLNGLTTVISQFDLRVN